MRRGAWSHRLTVPPAIGGLLALGCLCLLVAAPAGPPVRPAASLVTVAVAGNPSSLAFGDGALWVAAGDRVVRIDAASLRTAQARLVGLCQDSQVAYGLGSVWVTSGSCGPGAVYRLDPRTLVAHVAARIPAYVEGVAVWRGHVWVGALEGGSHWMLIGVDPASGPVLRQAATVGLDNLVATGEGLWARAGDGRLTSLIPAGGQASTAVATAALRAPAGVRLPFAVTSVAAGGGYVWAAGYESRRIVRIEL